MDKDFVRDIEFINEQSNTSAHIYKHSMFLDFMRKYNILSLYLNNVLDIGERNPLTTRIEHEFNISIDNTEGDLDKELICLHDQYDLVIFSHVIEHLFNPLGCLQNIKKVLKCDGLLIIACPIKPHFVRWGRGHFHEFDDYRFKKLINRARFKIIIWKKFSNYRWNTIRSYRGIRPFIRMFFNEQSFVILKHD